MTIASNHTKTATQKGVYAMKSLIEVCLVGSILIFAGGAQESAQPALKKGVSVQVPVADHAVEMRAADAPQATVVAITADGKLFAGTEPTEPSALSNPIMRVRN
jgi:biopolymer transport protein ExbD